MHKYYDNKDIVILWRRNRGEVQMRNYRIDICRVNMAERIDEHGCVDELSYAGLKVSKATCAKSIFLILLLLQFYEVNGVAFHGCPTRAADAIGNVMTGASNEEELRRTEKRRAQLAALVGAHNVVILTDRQVRDKLARSPATADSRLN
jgi:hypothetical protein